ncbi:MAG: competence/damage-inducible protein A [Oscillospiraceae bacterium]
MTHTAEIISVGTELLLGNIVNTDARDLSQMLSELGINVYFHTVVGDNPERLKSAIDIAKTRADIIITTGGLGPTCDDLTKQTLAEAFGKKLIFDEQAAEEIRTYFSQRLHSHAMTDNNYQQALLPEGCVTFHNTCGTAPGCAFEADGTHVLMLPGPPRECLTMFKLSAVPYLSRLSSGEIHSHNIHIFGMGESSVEDKLRPLMLELHNPTLAPYAKEGEVRLRVTAKAASAREAEALMAPVIDKVRAVLGPVIYGIDTETLENTVFGLLKEQGKTFAAAESCTGGLVAKRLTDIPGVSSVFKGCAVTYANEAKADILGVDPKLIEEKGAVCREVAMQMAQGARSRFGADIAVGLTGIAGPASDDTEKELGLVYCAMTDGENVWCRELHLGLDRSRVRTAAANHAFDMVRRLLTGLTIETMK